MVEWWKASDSAVTHARDLGVIGRSTYAVCNRALRWTTQEGEIKLVNRCGYCTYVVDRREHP